MVDLRFLSDPRFETGLVKWEQIPESALIDVRGEREYAKGHVPGSMNIPLDSIESIEALIPGKQTPIFVHCQSGVRSSHAEARLREMGYENVTNIGGINGCSGALARN